MTWSPSQPNRPHARKAAHPPPHFWVTALFLIAGVGLLWVPTRRVVAGARALDDHRAFTPATLAGPEGGLSIVSPPPVSLRPADTASRAVTFRLLAPAAQSVRLGGAFNGFDPSRHPMTRNEDGVWDIVVDLAPGRHEYAFQVDGAWRLDPTNPDRTSPPKEWSLIDVE